MRVKCYRQRSLRKTVTRVADCHGRKVAGTPTPSAARAKDELQAYGAQRFEGRFRSSGRPEDRAVEKHALG